MFFVLFIDNLINRSTKEKIELVEGVLKKFSPPGKQLNDVRKLLQVSFRDRLVKEVESMKQVSSPQTIKE